jgi:hypothetical protein
MFFCGLMDEAGDEATSDRYFYAGAYHHSQSTPSADPAITAAESGALPTPVKSRYR